MEKYLQRGVSAGKEEVHSAVSNLYHGLYPKAFCKVFPDILGGNDSYVNAMSSDGSGTKSVLAYLYRKETGDASVWQGIAQDALVMNLDDLVCIGATDSFLFTSIVNRNKHLITGEDIAQIIQGSNEFCKRMAALGIHIHFMGGETADLGDVVRTVTVDASMTTRLPKSELILTDNIRPGLVVVGLASYGQASYETKYNSGISSNGLTSARHDVLSKFYAENFPETFEPSLQKDIVYCGTKRLTDALPGTPLSIGEALLSPTRTFAPVVKELKALLPGKIAALINCTGGAQTKVLHYLPQGLTVVKDNLLPVPPLFNLIQEESKTEWKEMYKVLNCGTRMEVYVEEGDAQTVIDAAAKFNIAAQKIGYVAAGSQPKVVVQSEHGTFEYI
ncbi:MAG: phosphoribosylformylglycinamidine cyclo-ligase [Chitinophagales bacterium]|nr:phosphoribosylformylglycinamidine cyclo-ligase [Chitinophagales bacterium]